MVHRRAGIDVFEDRGANQESAPQFRFGELSPLGLRSARNLQRESHLFAAVERDQNHQAMASDLLQALAVHLGKLRARRGEHQVLMVIPVTLFLLDPKELAQP